jgi:uncharacterized protein (TIGR02246 family)
MKNLLLHAYMATTLSIGFTGYLSAQEKGAAVTKPAAPQPQAQPAPAAAPAADPLLTKVQADTAKFTAAFNGAKVDELIGLFSPKAEFVDEEGTIYQGTEEIKALFAAFFEKFPGAQLTMEADSVRPLGDKLIIEEGVRQIAIPNTDNDATLRYIAVHVKDGDAWKLAMVREFANDPAPTPYDYLMPLSMLEGDWVDENPAGVTRVSYRWNEEKTFLLGEYVVQIGDRPAMKSSQRLGWDPVQLKIRSWTFDSDGGFSEGTWTATDEGWIVKSTATLPNGQTGSATLTISVKDDDQISVKSFDRIIGDVVEEPFEITITRRPPEPAK